MSLFCHGAGCFALVWNRFGGEGAIGQMEFATRFDAARILKS